MGAALRGKKKRKEKKKPSREVSHNRGVKEPVATRWGPQPAPHLVPAFVGNAAAPALNQSEGNMLFHNQGKLIASKPRASWNQHP